MTRNFHTLGIIRFLSLSCAVLSSSVTASVPFQLKDIRLNPPTRPLPVHLDGSFLGEFVELGSVALFACDGPDGVELWRTDGNAAGTVMVKDIRPGPADSFPRSFTVHGEWVYFIADDGLHGDELWRSDGTAAGTNLVRDIRPGPQGSSTPSLHFLDDQLIFSADDGETGRELWRSDGTEAGTEILLDIYPGGSGSAPEHLTRFADLLFFIADDGVNGRELWGTDGSPEGTYLIKNTRPNAPLPPPVGISTDPPFLLSAMSQIFYFLTNDGVTGWELWTSDGSEAGTQLVRDITDNPPPRSTLSIDRLFDVGATTFFVAGTDAAGVELWKTDGTEAGTILVKDIYPGTSGSIPADFLDFHGELFFAASDVGRRELWRSDGTQAGTSLYFDAPSSTQIRPSQLTGVGEMFFFSGIQYQVSSRNTLFVTSGPPALPRAIPETGTQAGRPYHCHEITRVGHKIFFAATIFASIDFRENLWVSDGTDSGTIVLTTMGPITAQFYPTSLTPMFDLLLFEITTGDSHMLWKSDGTQPGTQSVLDVQPDLSHSTPHMLTRVGQSLFFRADDGAIGVELWKSDGTSFGTRLVKNIISSPNNYGPNQFGSLIAWMIDLDGVAIFAADNNSKGMEPWRSDGTSEGTNLILDIRSGTTGSHPHHPVKFDSNVYFLTDGSSYNGKELWKTDGTTEGTVRVHDFSVPAELMTSALELAVLGDKLFIVTAYRSPASVQYNQYALWASTGQVGNMTLIYDDWPAGAEYGVEGLTPMGDSAFFLATTHEHGQELWKTDGTNEGTVLVKDIRPGPESPDIDWMTPVGNLLFFTADGSDGAGHELWRSDGTPQGTVLVRDIRPGPLSSEARDLAAVGGALYFRANDGVHGEEPWRSDGVFPGTHMVKDIRPGPDSSVPAEFTDIPWIDACVFTAYTDDAGVELWLTDGSESGTWRISDIAPGPHSSNPRELTRVGDLLYFQANDFVTGRELWAMNIADVDGDGIPNLFDNCPVHPNTSQEDTDNDAVGDACDVCLNRHPGDVNGDFRRNQLDTEPFIAVLLDPDAASEDARCAADANLDGVVDARDIAEFIRLRRMSGRD